MIYFLGEFIIKIIYYCIFNQQRGSHFSFSFFPPNVVKCAHCKGFTGIPQMSEHNLLFFYVCAVCLKHILNIKRLLLIENILMSLKFCFRTFCRMCVQNKQLVFCAGPFYAFTRWCR